MNMYTMGLACAISLFFATGPAAAEEHEEFVDRLTLQGRLVPITGDRISTNLAVEFKVGSALLTHAAKKQLDELAAALSAEVLRGLDVEINGHTDASGGAEYNKTLSLERAESVRAFLVDDRGLDAARFTVFGFGEERLLEGYAPNARANRRVEIVTKIVPKKTKPSDDTGDTNTNSGFISIE